MSAWIWAFLGTVGAFAFAALGDLVSEEIRGWLDLLPRAILRLAAARLPMDQRELIYAGEWLPELCYALRGAESRPITRLITGAKFAIGLLVSAKNIARTLRDIPQSPPGQVVDVRKELHQVILSFHGRDMDVTEDVKASIASLGMEPDDFFELPNWLAQLSSDVTDQLPVGERIVTQNQQVFIPIFASEVASSAGNARQIKRGRHRRC